MEIKMGYLFEARGKQSIEQIKTAVAEFQEETRSMNVLEFVVWVENRITQEIVRNKEKAK